jgi:hypothetical protein
MMAAGAEAQTAPALQPIQIIPAAAVVKPATPVKAPVAKTSSTSSDEEALRQLHQAEAEFKAKTPVAPMPIIVAKPASSSASSNRSNNQQLPSVRQSSIRRSSGTATTAAARSRVRRARASVTKLDAAGLLTVHCAASKHPLRCMNRELNAAELRVDSAEVRLLNCRENRKFDVGLDKNVIDALVTGRMYQLRFKETQTFNANLAAAGRVSRMKTKEIEIRATIDHLGAVSALNSIVCSAPEFAKMYAAAQVQN